MLVLQVVNVNRVHGAGPVLLTVLLLLLGLLCRLVVHHPPRRLARALILNPLELGVQRQVVADRILPAFLVFLVVREFSDDELVDAAERQSFFGGFLDSHGDDITTLISRPKSIKSRPNLQENLTKSGPNLPLFRTGFTKT